jgi:4-amino-4-deoxy-L-arabinose transferase-like glycosyltransferase
VQGRESPGEPDASFHCASGARDAYANALTVMLALFILGLLSVLVLARHGNLAWDDADYLRRGLTNARLAEAAGPLWVLPRAIDRLLLEQPKPPWLVGWIEFGVHLFGRKSIDRLILFSTVLPYAFLMAAVVFLGRRLRGAWGGFVALLCLAASPLSLEFGGKVMVETSLALWVLCIYGLTAFYLAAPTRGKAAALGLFVGLALLTKLTIALFLPGPLIYGCARAVRGTAGGALFLKRLALSIAVCLAVAGPWYLKNAGTTVNFAIFSSKYNELATGRDRVPVSSRAALLANDLAGAPLFFTIAAGAIAAAFFRRKGLQADHEGAPGQANAEVYFRRMAWLGAGIAGIILLYPTYFDTRFLLPIWPVLAVAMGCWLSVQLAHSQIDALVGNRREFRLRHHDRRQGAIVPDLLED